MESVCPCRQNLLTTFGSAASNAIPEQFCEFGMEALSLRNAEQRVDRVKRLSGQWRRCRGPHESPGGSACKLLRSHNHCASTLFGRVSPELG